MSENQNENQAASTQESGATKNANQAPPTPDAPTLAEEAGGLRAADVQQAEKPVYSQEARGAAGAGATLGAYDLAYVETTLRCAECTAVLEIQSHWPEVGHLVHPVNDCENSGIKYKLPVVPLLALED